jgi:hypothetical protein
MRRDRRTFLQRFSQGPVDAPRGARHPWRWLMFEVARLPASPGHPSVVGLSDAPVLLFVVADGSFAVWCQGACRVSLEVPSHRLPPWPRLRRSRRAEPPVPAFRRSRASSPGTSSLAGCPSPDVAVNVYSRRSGDLLRPTDATPPVSLRPRGFSPPRRFLPFTVSGMLQPVPGLGSPGFARIGRRSRSFSDRGRVPRWRSTLRRFAPRRQPYRIAAACSPPAVRCRDDLAAVWASLPRLLAERRGRGNAPSAPVPPFPTGPPWDRQRRSARLATFESDRRCAVCPKVARLPRSHRGVRLERVDRRSPGCGDPGSAGRLATIVLRVRVTSALGARASRVRASCLVSSEISRRRPTPCSAWASLPARGAVRGGSSPRRWSTRVQRRSRRPLASSPVALCPRSGPAEGLAPPTSPYLTKTLPSSRDQFLPWVCFPFEACLPCRWCPRSPVGPIPPSVPSWAASSEEERRDGRQRLSGAEGTTVAGRSLPGVLDVKERL